MFLCFHPQTIMYSSLPLTASIDAPSSEFWLDSDQRGEATVTFVCQLTSLSLEVSLHVQLKHLPAFWTLQLVVWLWCIHTVNNTARFSEKELLPWTFKKLPGKGALNVAATSSYCTISWYFAGEEECVCLIFVVQKCSLSGEVATVSHMCVFCFFV